MGFIYVLGHCAIICGFHQGGKATKEHSSAETGEEAEVDLDIHSEVIDSHFAL